MKNKLQNLIIVITYCSTGRAFLIFNDHYRLICVFTDQGKYTRKTNISFKFPYFLNILYKKIFYCIYFY